jgi:hypothetical protein
LVALREDELEAMRLITAHKILIAASIVLALLLVARSASIYASTHVNSELYQAGVGLVLSAGLGLYLRALWRR